MKVVEKEKNASYIFNMFFAVTLKVTWLIKEVVLKCQSRNSMLKISNLQKL
jgi:hypothetical protein